MKQRTYRPFALTVLAAFVISPSTAACQEALLAPVEGFFRSVNVQKKTLSISAKKNGKQWSTFAFQQIKAVYIIPSKSETWPEWAHRIASRRDLPWLLAVYDPEAKHESGNAAIVNYSDPGNLEKFLQPGKSYVRVVLRGEATLK